MAACAYGDFRNGASSKIGINKSARSRTGTHTKTGSASSEKGPFLIRGLTHQHRVMSTNYLKTIENFITKPTSCPKMQKVNFDASDGPLPLIFFLRNFIDIILEYRWVDLSTYFGHMGNLKKWHFFHQTFNILCTTFWRVFDSLHCLRLTEVRFSQGGRESALELYSVLCI